MRKVIDGKRYDTQTARELGVLGDTTLFIKVTGQFFLYQNNPHKWPTITPISWEQARAWAMGVLDHDDLVDQFGNPCRVCNKVKASTDNNYGKLCQTCEDMGYWVDKDGNTHAPDDK